MKHHVRKILFGLIALLSFQVNAALDQFKANHVDQHYSNGWPREYSGVLFEQDAYNFMFDNAAYYVIDHFGTDYITSKNLMYLFSESTGTTPGSNELTHFYSHSAYPGPFSPPTGLEGLDSNGRDPRSCLWEGWTPGVTDGGYAFGGAVHFYGPVTVLEDFVDNYFKKNGQPYNLYAYVGSCFVDNVHFGVLSIPTVNVIKLHNNGK